MSKLPEKTVRIGIIGPGAISRKFAAGLKAAPGTELAGVVSRDPGRAAVFATDFGVPRVFDSYNAMLADESIDLVYIGLVNTMHYKVARSAILHGKGVILEKPFTLNAYEAERLIRLARDRHVFLMEAMWTRFHPVNRQVLEWCSSGRIGRISRVEASFGYFGGDNPESRQLNPALGGSALLDVGIYPLAYASMLLGEPEELRAAALQNDTGVDRQIEIAAVYKNATASLAASVTNQLGSEAMIFGDKGFIRVPVFFNPVKAILYRYGTDQESNPAIVETFVHAEPANGYEYEAIAAAEAFRQGLSEHPWLTLGESLSLMKQMDLCRSQLELVYPGERAILFDCDGVLVDSEDLLAKIAAALLNEDGIPAKPEDFRAFIGTGEERYIGGVCELYGKTYDPALKPRLYAKYFQDAPELLAEVPGAKALIRDLLASGVKVAVASSADSGKVLANLKALGIAPAEFAAVTTGSDVKNMKPDPEIYLKTAEAVGVPPEHCIVIEDAEAGIQAGKAGGMKTIGITTALPAARLREAGADQVVDSLDELYALLDIGKA